jgi:hypothetical protein
VEREERKADFKSKVQMALEMMRSGCWDLGQLEIELFRNIYIYIYMKTLIDFNNVNWVHFKLVSK